MKTALIMLMAACFVFAPGLGPAGAGAAAESILTIAESTAGSELVEIDDEVTAATVTPPLTEAEEQRIDGEMSVIVAYLDADGEVFIEEEVKQGERAPYPEDAPELEGFVFVHWYQESLEEDIQVVQALPFNFDQPILSDTQLRPYFVRNIDAFGLMATTAEEEVEEAPKGIEPEAPALPSGYDILGVLDSAEDGQIVYLVENEDAADILDVPELAQDIPPSRSVTFEVEAPERISVGDEIVLRGILTGFDGVSYTLQWQYSEGSDWVNIPGATEIDYTFTATEDTLNRYWRLEVTE